MTERLDCRAIWGAAYFKHLGQGFDTPESIEFADDVLTSALALAGQAKPMMSEEIWMEIDRGRYDAATGLKPDQVYHDDQYWFISYPGDPGGRWIRWDTRVDSYQEGEQ